MQPIQANVYAGIDTHADSHHVAVIDEHGRALGDKGFPTTASGYQRIMEFLHGSGHVLAVGVECTGSYGAEITRVLAAGRFAVVEVNRPNRQQRRLPKTDSLDAYSAAEAVMSGRATAAPKGRDGLVEALRTLRSARESAVRDRTATINQIKAMLTSAPESLRSGYRGLTTPRLVAVLALSRPPRQPVTAEECARYALRSLPGQALQVPRRAGQGPDRADHQAASGPRPGIYGCLRRRPGHRQPAAHHRRGNPVRLRTQNHFAALTGTCPVPASSGKTTRHRLNRGGDRKANSALHHIVLVRMRYHQPTQDYLARRTAEGRSKREIMRCLKRYVARQICPLLVQTLQPEKSVPTP